MWKHGAGGTRWKRGFKRGVIARSTAQNLPRPVCSIASGRRSVVRRHRTACRACAPHEKFSPVCSTAWNGEHLLRKDCGFVCINDTVHYCFLSWKPVISLGHKTTMDWYLDLADLNISPPCSHTSGMWVTRVASGKKEKDWQVQLTLIIISGEWQRENSGN